MTENEPTPTPEPTPSPKKRRRRRWLLFGLPIAALAGLFAARAFAHGFRHGCDGVDGEMTEEQLRDRREHMVDFAARYLDATPQQKTRMQSLAAEVQPQFLALRKESRALRDKAQEDAAASLKARDRAAAATVATRASSSVNASAASA